MWRLLITAGPTREPIDAVRFISNRSSGKLGIAITHEAVQHTDIEIKLLAGPGIDLSTLHALPAFNNTDRLSIEHFESTADLQALLESHLPWCDVLVMAAAVADYRPATTTPGKLGRTADNLTLTLTPTPDLVAGCAARKRADQRIIAFALEAPDMLEARAMKKLTRKGVDAIVANPLVTMEANAIQPLWLTANGDRMAGKSMSKQRFAAWLLERITTLRNT